MRRNPARLESPATNACLGLTPFDLKSVGHGITEQFSEKLMRLGLLPEGEFNDGLILAETALAGIPALVTSDAGLLDIEEIPLRVQFEAADLRPVQICHPKLLLKAVKSGRL